MNIRLVLDTVVAVSVLTPTGASAHGELLSVAPLTNAGALSSAAENLYVTYATDGIGGSPVTVSGTVANAFGGSGTVAAARYDNGAALPAFTALPQPIPT